MSSDTSNWHSTDPMFSFLSGGKEISLRRSTITAERLGRYFQFAPASVYVQEEFGNRVEFPNDNGKINLTGFLDGTSFLVSGDDINTVATSFASGSSTSYSATFATIAKKPWSLGGSDKGKGPKEPKLTVRVVYAELTPKGKPNPCTGVHAKQTFVPIYREEEATVDYISSFVSNAMSERVVLVGNNGIQYQDEPGTRGIAFWKKGSRKVYAVKQINPRKTKKPHTISIDDSDVDSDFDDTPPRASKQRKSDLDMMSSQLLDIETKMNLMEKKVDETKSEVLKVLTLTKDSRVPIAVKNIVKETFSCLICKNAPMNTPVIASRCCGAIIGCSACVDTWYSTGANIFNQTCPHCRGERAYSNTFRLNGLDDFLNKLREICDNDQV